MAMTFEQWIGGRTPPRVKGSSEISEDPSAWLNDMERQYGLLTTPDASGRLPYGTSIDGVMPSAVGGAPTFTMDGKSFSRIGAPNPNVDMRGIVPQYSPEYGYYLPTDAHNTLVAETAQKESAENAKSNAPFESLVYGIVGAGAGAAGLAAGGAGAAGGAAGSGSGIYGDLYLANNAATTAAGAGGVGATASGAGGEIAGGTVAGATNTGALTAAESAAALASATDPIQALSVLDSIGGAQGATAGAQSLGFSSVAEALGSVNPAWTGSSITGLISSYLSDPKSVLGAAATLGGAALTAGAVKGATSGSGAPAADPAIGRAAEANAATASEALQLGREQLDWQKKLFEEGKPLYESIVNAQLNQMRTADERGADQWARYKQLFEPVENRVVSDAMTFDSPERKEKMAAAAAADISASHDAALGLTRRTMESMGVNPADPRYASVVRQAGLARARDTAGAMNTARTNTDLTGMSMRQGVANFGRGLPSTSIAQDSAALNAGNAAGGNQRGIAGQAAAAGAAALPWYGASITGNNAAGSLYNSQFDAAMRGYAADQAARGAMWGGLGNLAGVGLGIWGSKGFPGLKDGGVVRDMLPRRYADGGVVDANYSYAGLVPRMANGGMARDPVAVEGEYIPAGANEPSIDPVDGEILDALCNDAYAMPKRGMPADGMVDGPGTETSDSIPARLSDGEAVLNASAVELLGEDFVRKVNAIGLQRRRGVEPADIDRRYAYEAPALPRRAIRERVMQED